MKNHHPSYEPFAPVERIRLADGLAERLVDMIRSGGYQHGDRLPTIMEMARSFGVGHPTLREALNKLEIIGVVEIKHGSGVYVGRGRDVLVVSNPVYGGVVSKKLMVDLVEARIPLEERSTELAATNATEEHLDRMTQLLDEAGRNLENHAVLSTTNMAFHHEISVASGNLVLVQLQEVLANLFQREQRLILDVHSRPDKDHEEHLGILAALRLRNPAVARRRMKDHLEGVRDVLLEWGPHEVPI